MADNHYLNAVTGATANPLMPSPDAVDEAFALAANAALENAVELSRELLGAHQAAAAIIVEGDWSSARKYFSLSEKYAAWARYDTPAKGFGSHAWFLKAGGPVRLTQTDLEAHPAWKGFGHEAGRHPPMRGWLAAPIVDREGKCWGLLQLSDRHEGEFTALDEANLVRLAGILSQTLEALWDLRNERKRRAAPPA